MKDLKSVSRPEFYVHVHKGNKGNESADALAKQGSKLRSDLLQLQNPNWFQRALKLYWRNRKMED